MTGSDALLREAAKRLADDVERYASFRALADLLPAIRAVRAALDTTPEPHVHKIEYPSSCTGCEHLAAAFVAAAPDWMLVGRAALDATNEPEPVDTATADTQWLENVPKLNAPDATGQWHQWVAVVDVAAYLGVKGIA